MRLFGLKSVTRRTDSHAHIGLEARGVLQSAQEKSDDSRPTGVSHSGIIDYTEVVACTQLERWRALTA